MAKKHSVSISIPKPCHENWDDMTSTEQGRHCASCNKTVVDFSLYTDKELFEFFKKANGAICGRINNYQINRPILITEQTNRTFFHKLFFGTALASWLGLASNASAQSNNINTITVQNSGLKKHVTTKKTNDTIYIKGTLIDANSKQSIPFANVTINGTTFFATTGIDGTFQLKLPNNYMHKRVIIETEYVGYEDLKKEVSITNNRIAVEIPLQATVMGLMNVHIIINEPDPLSSNPDKTAFDRDDNPYLPPRPHH